MINEKDLDRGARNQYFVAYISDGRGRWYRRYLLRELWAAFIRLQWDAEAKSAKNHSVAKKKLREATRSVNSRS